MHLPSRKRGLASEAPFLVAVGVSLAWSAGACTGREGCEHVPMESDSLRREVEDLHILLQRSQQGLQQPPLVVPSRTSRTLASATAELLHDLKRSWLCKRLVRANRANTSHP